MGSTHPSSSPSYTRRAAKAGTWYESNPSKLENELNQWLQLAKEKVTAPARSSTTGNSPPPPPHTTLRALICPHAGYAYSGPTAAYSYHALSKALASSPNNTILIDTIVVLHPSHHVYMPGYCAVSNAHTIQTPLGSLHVNQHLKQEIQNLHPLYFGTKMTQEQDEQEHSGEMQYPFLKHIFNLTKHECQVLPIMCGALNASQEQECGQLLAPILARKSICTIVSTDFCHWGVRFGYQPTPPKTSTNNNSTTPIHQFIRQLDQQGMDYIQWQQPGAFAKYLKQTRNTICGRHAVAIWLNAIAPNNSHASENTNATSMQIQHLHYDQSSQVTDMDDSSVSYVSSAAYLH